MTSYNDPRGSKWRKWDLHLHSPQTFLANKYSEMSLDDFVEEVIKSGVQVVGLTNYFRFEEKEFEQMKQKLNAKNIVVFPNLEFRTQPQNKKQEEMHIHLIFSDQTPIEKINAFLGRLQTIDGKYCSSLNKKEIETTSITFDSLKKQLKADTQIKYLQDYLIVACPRGQGSFRPSENDDGRGNTLAIIIDQGTDILFGNSDDVDFFLNDSRYEKAQKKPVLFCSDSHCAEDICKKFSWIKADKTFDGLKQTLWEPQERIRIEDRNPNDIKSDRIVIDRVTYKNSDNKELIVFFNRDLNSIIGKRGSGKSTLLKNIAYTVDYEQFKAKDGKDPYQLNEFKVFWADGAEDKGTKESPKSIFYIPQNYLSSLAYDDGDKIKERDAFLTSLLKKNAKFANAVKKYAEFTASNKVKIEELIQQLLTANLDLKESDALLKKQGSKEEIQNEIKRKTSDIKRFKDIPGTNITDEEIAKYTESKKRVFENTNKKTLLLQDKNILANLIQNGADIVIVTEEFNFLSDERRKLIQKEVLDRGNKNLEPLFKEEIGKIDTQLSQIEAAIKNDESQIAILDIKIKQNKALSDLTKEVDGLGLVLAKIEELQKKIKDASDRQSTAMEGLLSAYKEYDVQQDAIYKTISFDEKFAFLKVQIIAAYDTNDLKNFVERTINTRDSDATLKLESDIKNFFSDSPQKPEVSTMKKVIGGLIEGKIRVKVEVDDISTAISLLLKNRYEIDYLNSVKTQDGVHFKNMTGGQKAIALLELVFKFDDEKYPILIDQPEDDLDVGGVATDLVNFIKIEKIDRQIIIASHNASLVICSDTEEVVVSESKSLGSSKYDFLYSTGAIENLKIAENIVDILEGGREALRMRARKLNFKDEL